MTKAAVFSKNKHFQIVELLDMSVILTGGGELITLSSRNAALLEATPDKGYDQLTLKFGDLVFHQTPIANDANFTFKKEIRGNSIMYTLELLLQPTVEEAVNSDG